MTYFNKSIIYKYVHYIKAVKFLTFFLILHWPGLRGPESLTRWPSLHTKNLRQGWCFAIDLIWQHCLFYIYLSSIVLYISSSPCRGRWHVTVLTYLQLCTVCTEWYPVLRLSCSGICVCKGVESTLYYKIVYCLSGKGKFRHFSLAFMCGCRIKTLYNIIFF